MKRIILATAIAAAFTAYGLYVPKSSVRQMSASPLQHAELCWVENTNGFAEAYIGGIAGTQLRVKDPASLRGYRLRRLDKSEYAVAAGPAFTYNAVADTYTMTQAGVTNQIVISVKDGLDVKNIGLRVEGVGEGIVPPQAWYHKTMEGSVARVDVALGAGCVSVVVSQIAVDVRAFGDEECVNDLESVVFELIDPIGRYNLRDLRTWARDLYNGNRGEDWSKYKATHVVDLASKPVRVTSAGDFTWSVSTQTNLILQVGRRDAMVFSSPPSDPIDYTYFRISSIDVSTSDATVLGFVTDIADFNVANLGDRFGLAGRDGVARPERGRLHGRGGQPVRQRHVRDGHYTERAQGERAILPAHLRQRNHGQRAHQAAGDGRRGGRAGDQGHGLEVLQDQGYGRHVVRRGGRAMTRIMVCIALAAFVPAFAADAVKPTDAPSGTNAPSSRAVAARAKMAERRAQFRAKMAAMTPEEREAWKAERERQRQENIEKRRYADQRTIAERLEAAKAACPGCYRVVEVDRQFVGMTKAQYESYQAEKKAKAERMKARRENPRRHVPSVHPRRRRR